MQPRAIPARVQGFREEYRTSYIGARYSGWGHFALTTVVSLLAIGMCAHFVRAVRPWEWAVVPLAFLLANAVEYAGHKGPMHHRRRGLGLLFERHTVKHHHFYTHEAMDAESPRDFKMVLFPPVMLLFFIGGVAVPVGSALFLVAGRNVALLFSAVAVGYYLTYEWLHFAYHQSPESFVGRLPLVRVLRRHHRTHHDLALMGRYNFNITFPVMDWVRGTTYRGEPR